MNRKVDSGKHLAGVTNTQLDRPEATDSLRIHPDVVGSRDRPRGRKLSNIRADVYLLFLD